MGAAEKLIQLPGIGVGQILLLQGNKGLSGRLVVMGDLKTEPIGLMFHTSGNRIGERRGEEQQDS